MNQSRRRKPQRAEDVDGRAPISLGGKQYRSPGSFALAAAEAANWDAAKDLLLRGAVATWASEAGFEPRIPSALRQFARADGLTDDLRLSIALKTLNPSMPLIVQGQHRHAGMAPRPSRRRI